MTLKYVTKNDVGFCGITEVHKDGTQIGYINHDGLTLELMWTCSLTISEMQSILSVMRGLRYS